MGQGGWDGWIDVFIPIESIGHIEYKEPTQHDGSWTLLLSWLLNSFGLRASSPVSSIYASEEIGSHVSLGDDLMMTATWRALASDDQPNAYYHARPHPNAPLAPLG